MKPEKKIQLKHDTRYSVCRSHHLINRLGRLELHLARCCVYTLRDLSLNAQQDRASEIKKYDYSKDLITN